MQTPWTIQRPRHGCRVVFLAVALAMCSWGCGTAEEHDSTTLASRVESCLTSLRYLQREIPLRRMEEMLPTTRQLANQLQTLPGLAEREGLPPDKVRAAREAWERFEPLWGELDSLRYDEDHARAELEKIRELLKSLE